MKNTQTLKVSFLACESIKHSFMYFFILDTVVHHF